MLKRALEATVLEELRHRPVVAILGPRQVGKTTLARSVAAGLSSRTVHLDLEREVDRRKLADPEAYLSWQQDACVVIDEVQQLPEIFSALRPIVDADRRPGRFLLTGSAAPQMVQGITESLAGRVAYLELAPVNAVELHPSISLQTHWLRGGFPEPLLMPDDAKSAAWHRAFLRSYVERDLAQLFGVSFSAGIVQRFWRMLAASSGSVWNAESYARSLGITAPTVLRYLDFLEAAFMVRRLLPWYVNTGKRLVRSPKVYVRDSGLLHSLAGIDDVEELFGSLTLGSSWESYAVEQICTALPAAISAYFYRTHRGAECDVVLVKAERVLACVELKFSAAAKPSRGFYESVKTLTPRSAWCVSFDGERYPGAEGVTMIGLREFLSEGLLEIGSMPSK